MCRGFFGWAIFSMFLAVTFLSKVGVILFLVEDCSFLEFGKEDDSGFSDQMCKGVGKIRGWM